VSVAVFFIFALYMPEVALFKNTSARDAAIQSIKSETVAGRLQQTASIYVSASYATGTTATVLCCIALGTLLLVSVGSVVGLIQVRRMEKLLSNATNAT
jgi:hypothetical protein